MNSPGVRRGPGRPRGADGAETRQRLLRSARDVFATTGFDRASLKQIAEDADLTRNAIANYYASKMELYTAALESVQVAVVEAILADARHVDGPVHARVMAVFTSAIGFSQDDPTFVRFFVTSTADAIHHPNLRELALRPLETVHGFVRDLLEGAASEGKVSAEIDVEATTQMLMDLIWGLAMDVGFYSDADRTPRTLAAIRRVLAAALGAPSADAGDVDLASSPAAPTEEPAALPTSGRP